MMVIQLKSLDFRQKIVLLSLIITFLFITFYGNIRSVSNVSVNKTVEPIPTSKNSNRSKTRIRYPEVDSANFTRKLNPFKGTTTTTTVVYKELKGDEICVVPHLTEKDVKYGIKSLESNACGNTEFVDVSDSGDVTISKSAPASVTCCLKVKVKAPPDPKDKKRKTGHTDICDNIFRTVVTKAVLDYLEINCSYPADSVENRTEYHARFTPKVGAQGKKKIWEAYLKEKKTTSPPSILLLGLSSISNREARQLLPRTNKLLLKEMGFLAYNQYLKSGETLAESLFQMLTGTNVVKILESTNSTEKVAQGTIVNSFNRIKYVSFKIVQEFFYLFKVPFSTDYTVNSLVDAYHFGMEKKYHSCFQHNLLQEIFSFSTKILTEYKSVPSFGTIWLDLFTKSIPNEAFPTADKVLHGFFTKNKENLKNTIVILVSDEGTHNYSDFEGQGYTGNNFPLLYIHFPKHLRKKPGALANRNIPISAKDIYNTLQATLADACSKVLKSSKPFPAESLKVCKQLGILDSSVTLWNRIKPERDLRSLGISENVWQIGCNAETMNEHVVSTQDLEYMSQFLLHFLNQVIDDFFKKKVKNNCDYWVLEIEPVSFHQVIRAGVIRKKGVKYMRQDVLIVVKVQPDRPNPALGQLIAEFEAVIRMDKAENDLVMHVLGFPKRIPQPKEFSNKYSKCVFGDRHFKVASVCYCKTKPQFKYRHVKGAITDY